MNDHTYSDIIKFEIFNKKNLENRKFINKIKKELISYVRCYEVFVEDVQLSFLFKIDNEFHLPISNLNTSDIFGNKFTKKVMRDLYEHCELNHEIEMDFNYDIGQIVRTPFVYSKYKIKGVTIYLSVPEIIQKIKFQQCFDYLIQEANRRIHKWNFFSVIHYDVERIAYQPNRHMDWAYSIDELKTKKERWGIV